MKRQLQILGSFLITLLVLGSSTSQAFAGLTPPKGKGGTTTCGSSSSTGSTNCDNQNAGQGECYDVETGEENPL